jgi:hypothetical protein
MTRMFLSASVATLALIASPGAAQKEERGGKDRGGQSAKVERGGGGGGGQRAERPQRQERAQRVERPQQMRRAERPQRMERMQRIERPQRQERQVQRAERPQRVERAQRIERAQRPQRIERAERPQRIERAERRQRIERAERPQRVEQARRIERDQRREHRGNDRRAERAAARIDRDDNRVFQRERAERSQAARTDRQALRRAENRSLRQAFFARQNDRPLLLARDLKDRRDARGLRDWQRDVIVGQRIDLDRYSSVIPFAYRTRYYDTDDWTYRYDDGYLYRIGRRDNILNALIPLGGSSYFVGDQWPSYYQSSYVPYQYSGMYYDTPYYDYRYADGGIYRVNAQTGLISALMALLTGYPLGVGSRLPATYDVYNVPYGYRDYYRDTSDSWYRYNDGYIYDVDPRSRIIRSSYPIYDDNYAFGVGQPWPIAYPDYNVPYGYRDMYVDTPQWHYRYVDGGIYQVDPQTRMIQALVALVTGDPFVVGQPMPVGYSAYNVPIDYRERYYDTADANYRYSNGVVYRVDPITGLVERGYPIYA